MYLIHSEGDGTPHCVAVRRTVVGTVHVLDGDVEWEMPINVLDQVTVECEDRATLVTFIVYKQSGIQTALTPPPFPDAYTQLLELQAGVAKPELAAPVGSSIDLCIDLEQGNAYAGEGDMDEQGDDQPDDAVINVGDKLLRSLEAEVQATLRNTSAGKRNRVATTFKCPLCPFRFFARRGSLFDHIRHQHRESKQ